MLTTAEALRMDITGMNVLVIGLPASGKTFFTGWLGMYNPAHRVFRTDDYLQMHNGEAAMYAALQGVTAAIQAGQKTIVEGVAGYRMLRKGAQLEMYYPGLVFEIVAPEEQRRGIYEKERPGKAWKNVQVFDKALATVLRDYNALIDGFRAPTWVQVQNVFMSI